MPPTPDLHREPMPPIQPDTDQIGLRRRALEIILRHKDADLIVATGILCDINPERAEEFLNEIVRIDPASPDREKTKALDRILDHYSPHTLGHSRMARDLVRRLNARKHGTPLRFLRLGALARAMETHDYGKLGMPDSTLNMPHDKGYSPRELYEKERHPLLGQALLKYLQFHDEMAPRIALTHHLRYKTVDGRPELSGYPIEDFKKYCDSNNLEPVLTPEDHLAAFVDVYTAATDPNRPTKLHKSNKPGMSDTEKVRTALEEMDGYFEDDFYQKGEGAPLYKAFKEAMMADAYPVDLAA